MESNIFTELDFGRSLLETELLCYVMRSFDVAVTVTPLLPRSWFVIRRIDSENNFFNILF